jgi:hypothetical protein
MAEADALDGATEAQSSPSAPHSRRRWVPVAFLIGVLITQFAWAWATPPFRGIDEIDHAFRAASVADGDVNPSHESADHRGILVKVPPRLAADARAQCEALTSKEPTDCVPEATLAGGDVLIFSTASGYSPVYYEVIGPISKPWDGVTQLYVMRGAASVVNALLLLLAAWCLMARSRSAWPMAGLLIALTPMALYTSMLPAPNGVELCAAAVLWCALLGLQGADRRYHGRLLTAVAVAGVVLGSVRMSGPVLIVLIAACVAMLAPRRTWDLVRSRWKASLVVVFVTSAATLYQLQWALAHPPLSGINDRVPFDLTLILGQVGLWVFQWMGAFPYRNQPASPLTYLATGIAMVLLWGIGLRRGDAKRWMALVVVGTCVLVPLLYTLATYTHLGTFWQGRYALPLLIGAPILIGLALDRPNQEFSAVLRLVPLLVLVSTSAALIHVVHLELERPASAGDPHWHPPVTIVIVLLATASSVAFDRMLAWAEPAGVIGHQVRMVSGWRRSDQPSGEK